MSETVLVTGGAGYVGSHACKALARAGYTPVTYDNLSRGHVWAVRWGPLEVGDLSDRLRLRDVIVRHRPLAVMHFAAFAYVGESVTHPDRYYLNNVQGSLSLLEILRELGVGRMIFSSTCATYGIPRQCPILEDEPQAPVNPYGFGKLVVERMLQDFGMAYGMRHVALRYFNAAGADPEGQVGEAHDPETHLIPSALLTAAEVRPALHVHGVDYPTADGTCVRDYVHVSDLADAHVLALRYLLAGGESCSVNLGSGHGVSVRTVIETVRRVTRQPIRTIAGPRRAGDPPALYASGAAAERVLGWQPRHTDLEEIVTHAWRWMQTALPLGYIR